MSGYGEEAKKRRMSDDRAMIGDTARWPLVSLQMKTQPWVQPQEFGEIYERDLLAVHLKDRKEVRHYPSMESLVETWSVD